MKVCKCGIAEQDCTYHRPKIDLEKFRAEMLTMMSVIFERHLETMRVQVEMHLQTPIDRIEFTLNLMDIVEGLPPVTRIRLDEKKP